MQSASILFSERWEGSSSSSFKHPSSCKFESSWPFGPISFAEEPSIFEFQHVAATFCGPGDIYVDKHLPPGSESFQLELSPSGHIVLPCCEYGQGAAADEHTLTLLTEGKPAKAPRTIPPPPREPPILVGMSGGHTCPPHQSADGRMVATIRSKPVSTEGTPTYLSCGCPLGRENNVVPAWRDISRSSSIWSKSYQPFTVCCKNFQMPKLLSSKFHQ